MINWDLFFPYMLLIFCVAFGCIFYRVVRIEAFCNFLCHSGENSICRRWTRNGTSSAAGSSGSEPSHNNLEVPVSPDGVDSSLAVVESLLRQNLARATLAGREARRLASILATSRGISTEECLETEIAARENVPRGFVGNFALEFEDDDLPPSYEDCVVTIPEQVASKKDDDT